MFRSARWRSEKNKIKAVFKLHFHATQVSQLNVDALVISVVPGDVGKPTARLEKGIIREGGCRWEYPVYETVKFTEDARTGKINEKTYHFIVSTGSSKNSLVGEVSIDLANYAENTKVSNVSLPLKNSKSNGVLHVSIQRLQGNIDQRDEEETEDTNIKSGNRALNTLLSNNEAKGNKNNSNEVGPLHEAIHNGDSRTSSGSDITMSSSESSSGLNTPRALGLRNNEILRDSTSFLSSQSPASVPHKPIANASAKIYEEHQQSQWEWSADSDHGISTDDSIGSSVDNFTRERSEHTSDIEIEKLKDEIVAFARQVELSELELQTLRKQIVKESKRGQDLSREVTGLKEERDFLKAECEKLRAFQKCREGTRGINKLQFERGDARVLLEEIRQELNYEKDLNANLRLQLQKTQESNAELILAVKDLEEMLELEQKNRETPDPSNKSRSSENAASRSDTDDDEEQKALEKLVKEHRDAKETCLLEQRIIDLSNEMEMCRRDKDELEIQMEQLALDYEILKQEKHEMSYKLKQSELQDQLKLQYECSSFANINELEDQVESLENELKKQSEEYSESMVTINELKTYIKILEDELEKRTEGFEADLEAITNAKVEQEQRAIRAEEALRKTRWNNANTAESLQEEFKKLSMQMAATFDANEKVAVKSLAEANNLRLQKSQLEEMLQKANGDLQSLRDDYETKLHYLCNQLNLKKDQIEQMLVEIEDKRKQLEHQKFHEEELVGSFSQEIIWLKNEIEKFTIENNILSEQAEQKENMRVELEQLKTSIKHTEELVQKGNMERDELVSTLALMEEEGEKLMEELHRMKSLKDEREKAVKILQAEVESLTAQCNDLKSSLFEDELEKEKLRKQVFQLKSDIKKKDDAVSSMEKKLKESNKRTVVSDSTRMNLRNNKSVPVSHGTKEAANLREKIRLLEGQVKLKETALETSANSFLEKERDLLNKIEELEHRVEELNQKSVILSDNPCQKLPEDTIGNTSNGGLADDIRSTNENLSDTAWMSRENGNAKSLVKSNSAIISEKEVKTCDNSNGDCNTNELLSELASLKERNKLMENELKEMQERYSDISLKFAEVEGERQQLMMTLRHLKNSKKR
uniref:C2 NT-type domain-containing protein n=1 Tax=Manihot esculenta TaxID=3983 RepID=A0A2C9WBS1_MANES